MKVMENMKNFKNMKKKKKIIILTSSALVVAIIGFVLISSQFNKSTASALDSYSSTTVTKGNIEVSIEGSGTVNSTGTAYTYAQSDGTVSAVYKNAGEEVKAGDVIAVLTNSTLVSETNSLKSSLTAIDLELTSSNQSTSDGYIYAPVDARIKKIYATTNSSVPVIIAKYDGLMLLSTDGNMVLNVTLGDTKVSVGDKITLTIGSTTKTATVTEASSTSAKILVAGDTYSMDTKVTAKNSSGTVIGTGTLVPNKPITISATTGTITAVYYSVNSTVTQGSKLFAISGALSSSTESLIAKREQAAQNYATSKAKVAALTIKATSDGTLVSQNLSVGDTVKSGDELCAIKTSSDMAIEIAVDEEDINDVKIGQTAKITFDAIDDKTYTGTVTSVSRVGTTGSVTTYPVTIVIKDAEGVNAGMNASATIVTESKTDILLVPVGAILGSGDNKYVLTSVSGTTSTATNTAAPSSTQSTGTATTQSGRTTVTVGLINGSYAEITSGLNEGDTIYYRNAGSSSSSGAAGMMGVQSLTGGSGTGGAGGTGGTRPDSQQKPSN